MKADIHPAVAELDELLHDQPKNPMRPNQVASWQGELDRLERMASQPPEFAGTARGFARRRHEQIRRMVDGQVPKKITDETRRNRVHALCKTVLREAIIPRLITKAESDRNPPGAVGYQMKFGEFSKPFKRAAMTWKRGMLALDPTGDGGDPDFTNYARYQPTGARPDGTSHFIADAQLPGKFAMSPLAKANWPWDDPDTSALAQVKAREEHENGHAAKRGHAKRPLSEAQRAAIDKMRAGRSAKIAARRGETHAPPA